MLRDWLFLGILAVSICATRGTQAQALPSTVQVAMPDGVSLATDVWRPLFDNKPRPVLLRRTPYGRAVDLNVAQALVAAGFVLVSQDVRGRGASKGVFEPFFDDKVDGKTTIEWAAAQPWSNGAVATYSNSAEGIVQYMAMQDAPKGLRCAHLGMPTHDLYEGLFPGGVWRSELGTTWLTQLGAASVVDLWKSHEVHDGYWDDATLSTAEMASIDHPVFIMGGFFDIFSHSEVRALRELQANVAPASREDVFLILGPWTHGGIGLRGQGELIYPEDARYTAWVTELLAYMKWCTMDGPRPAFAQVRYYLTEITDQTMVDPADNVLRTIARGEWRDTTTWPPPGGQEQRLLISELRSAVSTSSIPVSPDAAVPSLGGGNLTTKAGPYDQTTIDARPDVLVFASQPMTGDVELIGSPTVELWVSSATTDLDVIVRLEVLTPMGKAIAITDGVRRGRFVDGFDAVRPLMPGEPALFELSLGPVALHLTPGQALRIAVSGTSSPRYEPNPNVATPLAQHPVPVATTLSLMRDASRLILPIAAGTLPGAHVGEEEPVMDAGVVRDAGLVRDAGEHSVDAQVHDASLTTEDPVPEGDDGCACSAHGRTTRLDLSALLLALSLLSRRSKRATGEVAGNPHSRKR
jgi:hypothetical protein